MYSFTDAEQLLGIPDDVLLHWLTLICGFKKPLRFWWEDQIIQENQLYLVAANLSIRWRSKHNNHKPGSGMYVTRMPRKDMPLEKHYSTPRAARILGVTTKTLHRWLIDAGYEPPEDRYRLRSKTLVIPKTALEQVLAHHAYQRSRRFSSRWKVSELEIAKAHVLFNRLRKIKSAQGHRFHRMFNPRAIDGATE
jgi:hypothetical protein